MHTSSLAEIALIQALDACGYAPHGTGGNNKAFRREYSEGLGSGRFALYTVEVALSTEDDSVIVSLASLDGPEGECTFASPAEARQFVLNLQTHIARYGRVMGYNWP